MNVAHIEPAGKLGFVALELDSDQDGIRARARGNSLRAWRGIAKKGFRTAAVLGTIVLARAVQDPHFSKEILESARNKPT